MVDPAEQSVLLVSNEPDETRLVLEAMAARGVRGVVARDGKSASQKLDETRWAMVLADADILGDDAHGFVRWVRREQPEAPVVMVSGRRSVEQAVEAMRAGCEEFLVRPLDREVLDGLFEQRLPNRVEAECAADSPSGPHRIVGRSRKLLAVLATAAKVARTSIPVLISGESGTGKELICHYIHTLSRRGEGPYVRVNCAAMSESLLESELFGHERGAFTGAISQRKGLFERAHAGTLLLDEVSETSGRLQAALLRVLDRQDFERVGGSEAIRVDVRVISTSNRDLGEAVESGRFRRDLYYRLSGVHLTAPPLRERTEDIEPLVWHFVNQYAREVRRRVTSIAPEMLEQLSRHAWPGNVRELRNVVRAALTLGQGEALSLGAGGALRRGPEPSRVAAADETLSLRDVEREAILEALRRTKSHHAKAADLLGITDRTLREKLRRYRRDGVLQPAGESRWLTETA